MSVLRVFLSVLLLLCLSSFVLASSKGQGQQSLEAFVTPVGEGTACSFRGSNGRCTASTCNGGYKVSGRCPGPTSVRCCLPGSASDSAGHYDQPASTVRKSLAGAFPYKFPYSSARHIVADIAKQRIRLYDGSSKVKEWKISSGKNGVSFTPNSLGSPVGRFRIIGRYGDGAPLGMQFEAFKAIGKIGYPTDAKAHVQTRVLQITGLDKENANTAARAIYIHGTNAEMQLGWKGSHGCFRMGNADVVELFNMVKTGTEFYAVPSGAWPN